MGAPASNAGVRVWGVANAASAAQKTNAVNTMTSGVRRRGRRSPATTLLPRGRARPTMYSRGLERAGPPSRAIGGGDIVPPFVAEYTRTSLLAVFPLLFGATERIAETTKTTA